MDINSTLVKRFGKKFKKGDILFCEYEPGDCFFLIDSGRVQIVKILGDIEKIIDILEPGEVFGEMAILEGEPRLATAIALDDLVALEFNRANFEVLMQGNPQIALKLLKLFTKRIYDQKRRFMILTLDEDDAKVADVFLMLAEKEAINISASETVELKASIDDISHWAGMAPDKCKKIVNHFATQNRIEIQKQKIIIKNINDFNRFVNSKRKHTGN